MGWIIIPRQMEHSGENSSFWSSRLFILIAKFVRLYSNLPIYFIYFALLNKNLQESNFPVVKF